MQGADGNEWGQMGANGNEWGQMEAMEALKIDRKRQGEGRDYCGKSEAMIVKL